MYVHVPPQDTARRAQRPLAGRRARRGWRNRGCETAEPRRNRGPPRCSGQTSRCRRRDGGRGARLGGRGVGRRASGARGRRYGRCGGGGVGRGALAAGSLEGAARRGGFRRGAGLRVRGGAHRGAGGVQRVVVVVEGREVGVGHVRRVTLSVCVGLRVPSPGWPSDSRRPRPASDRVSHRSAPRVSVEEGQQGRGRAA